MDLKYTDGKPIPLPGGRIPDSLVCGRRRSRHDDYRYLACLPAEHIVGGFRIDAYEAHSARAPFPFMAQIMYGTRREPDRLFFDSREDLVRYGDEHCWLKLP